MSASTAALAAKIGAGRARKRKGCQAVRWWISRASYDEFNHPVCPNCGLAVDPDTDDFCPRCATPIREGVDESLYDEAAAAGEGTPSSGRQAWEPAERADYLDSLPSSVVFDRHVGGGGQDLNSRITAAEELVAVTEAAWNDATDHLRDVGYHARHQHLAERANSLTPAERSEYVEAMQAQAHWQRCEADHERARANLNRLLAQWDEIAQPPTPGPSRNQLFQPPEDDWMGLSPTDRNRGY